MEFAEILGRILFAALIAVVYIVVLAMFVRRLLGVAVGLGRIIVAGLIGLGAELGFESRFIWKDPEAGLVLLPVQIGIVLIVATLFLVLAELVFPSGTLMRPDKWIGSLKARFCTHPQVHRGHAHCAGPRGAARQATKHPGDTRGDRRTHGRAAARCAWPCRNQGWPS